jgi:hypothetical protein
MAVDAFLFDQQTGPTISRNTRLMGGVVCTTYVFGARSAIPQFVFGGLRCQAWNSHSTLGIIGLTNASITQRRNGTTLADGIMRKNAAWVHAQLDAGRLSTIRFLRVAFR